MSAHYDAVPPSDLTALLAYLGPGTTTYCRRLAPISDPLPLTPAQRRQLAQANRRLAWHRFTTELAFETALRWSAGIQRLAAWRALGRWRLDNTRCVAQERAQAILFPLRCFYTLLCLRNNR